MFSKTTQSQESPYKNKSWNYEATTNHNFDASWHAYIYIGTHRYGMYVYIITHTFDLSIYIDLKIHIIPLLSPDKYMQKHMYENSLYLHPKGI